MGIVNWKPIIKPDGPNYYFTEDELQYRSPAEVKNITSLKNMIV